jgi:hypothetical protein
VQCGGRVRISLTGEGQVSGTGLEAPPTGGVKVGLRLEQHRFFCCSSTMNCTRPVQITKAPSKLNHNAFIECKKCKCAHDVFLLKKQLHMFTHFQQHVFINTCILCALYLV